MHQSLSITKFIKDDKYILHPYLDVKNNCSIAIPPFITEYHLSCEELLDKALFILTFSKEADYLGGDPNVRYKEYLKSMGVKTMKALHDGSICLAIYVRDGIITFMPWKNLGSRNGFVGYKEDMDVKLSFDSPKEELVEALNLALSRCI